MTGKIVSLSNSFISTDVVCVKFFGSFVLAGVGGLLKVFCLQSNCCVKEIEVFKGHKIYGIVCYSENFILIFGGKEAQVYSFSNLQNGLQLSCTASVLLDDWILAAHWLRDGNQVVLVTAHNVAWLWSELEIDSSTNHLKCALCSEKCILYSATVGGEKWTNSVIFAGTVFREVIMWMPGGTDRSDQPVLHRLLGHNGVIFSLSWDCERSLLCSTSDDRSVRLWHVDLPEENDWHNSKVVCSSVLYGHSARVWRSVIFHDKIVSVGEDCKICVWNEAGKLLQIIDRTASGCQWSVDFSAEHHLLVTGAGDGSVQLLPLSLPLHSPAAICIPFNETLLNQVDLRSIRKLAVLNSGIIVTVTEDGTLLSVCTKTCLWKVLFRDERFSNYCVLSVSPDRSRFSLSSIKGLVILSQDAGQWTVEQKLESGKIWSLLWLSQEKILVCGDEGRMSIWQIPQVQETSMTCVGRFRLPRARERWPTSATLVSDDGHCFLLCGDRCGSLHLFRFSTIVDNEYLGPNSSLSKIHGKLGVTSIHEFNNKILTTGRDGKLRTIGVDFKSMELMSLSADKMIMDWVCTVLPSSRNLFVVGFKETNMIVWSKEERRTVLELDCGGGHRSWDCSLTNERVITYAFIREKQIYHLTVALDTLMKPTLQHGVSSRELNSVCAICDIPSTLAFGGEDGSVYICKFSNGFRRVQNRIALTSHISNVRCVCFHEGFLFSAGGRAQLKAWKIKADSIGEISSIELASHMLKGERRPSSFPAIDPEMRFMCMCGIPSDIRHTTVQLLAGCSDGALRWIQFNPTSKTIEVTRESMFHGKCILKVLSVRLHDDNIVLISCATDGMIALWTVINKKFGLSDNFEEPLWSSKIHQSGVNSLSVQIIQSLEGFVLLIASGGDDNAIVLNALQFQQGKVLPLSKWSCSSAHAAQITGVWLVGEFLVSTSIDQRLTIWHWKLSMTEKVLLNCDFVVQSICSVPDIQDMHVIQTVDCLHVTVVGKGVQVVTIPLQGEQSEI